MNGKRLYKSNNKKICGVCAGIAEYFDIDPTIVRLIWAALTLAGGSGIIIYIVAALVMDDDPGFVNQEVQHDISILLIILCGIWQNDWIRLQSHMGITEDTALHRIPTIDSSWTSLRWITLHSVSNPDNCWPGFIDRWPGK